MGVLPAVCLGLGMLFLPASPRWLMSRQREGEARTVLARMQGPSRLEASLAEIRMALAGDPGSGSWAHLKQAWLRPALFIGVGIMFVHQMTGINTVIYYAPTIFEMAGFRSASAAIAATAGVGALNVAMTVVSLLVIDRIGRRPLLLVGLTGMVLSTGFLGLSFSHGSLLGPGLKWYAVTGILVYIASFAISLGPIAWLLIAEIYPLKVRGLAMSLATLSNWAFNFIVALSFLSLVDLIGRGGAFWLFSLIGLASLFFCYFFVPETKGCSLEDIEADMHARKPPRLWGSGK